MNVFDDYSGSMYVNGVNYRKLNSASLYDKISVVTQTPLAINGTIKDNLDFGNKLSDSQLEDCLKNAEILDFVKQLPLGINTVMGDNGQNLSGGQKQRIAIARAISKNPELIIFDEGTNSLDQLTEQKIYHNLQSLNITQLIISHRLAAIQDADYIYVLSHGEIIEEGIHDELIAKKGVYYRNFLDNKQIEGRES
ncbi:MAG: ATP-binding cassette domain-containing protein [Lactobacillus sp.]|nr:ATP-binding cassette domain-containing protein [Lactobacillus sp.]